MSKNGCKWHICTTISFDWICRHFVSRPPFAFCDFTPSSSYILPQLPIAEILFHVRTYPISRHIYYSVRDDTAYTRTHRRNKKLFAAINPLSRYSYIEWEKEMCDYILIDRRLCVLERMSARSRCNSTQLLDVRLEMEKINLPHASF